MLDVQTVIKMVRQEAGVRLETGTVTGIDYRGSHTVSVRLSGGRVCSRVRTCISTLDIDDRVLVARLRQMDRPLIIGQILSEYESELSHHGVLAPPENLTALAAPGVIWLQWDSSPQEDLFWQVQHNSSASATNATDALVTQGSYFRYPVVDEDADTGTPVTRHFRVRAIRWIGDNNAMYSAWSAWANATSVTWDGRYYTETEISSNANAEGASLVGIEDAGGKFTGTDVEAALTELTDGTITGVHDHSAAAKGGQNLRQLLEVEFDDASGLTIDGAGAVTRTQVYHSIDTNGGAATDNLDTVNGGAQGDFLIIKATDDARTVVVRHNQGNIWLSSTANISLDDAADHLALVYDGSLWCDVGWSAGGSGSVPAAGKAGDMLVDDGAAWQRKTITQDADMAASGAATVTGIQGRPVSNEQPEVGDFLQWISDAAGCPGASDISDFWAISEIDWINHVDNWIGLDNNLKLRWQPDTVALLRNGAVTEYDDPDDAFTAADTAGDVILAPPGTWTLTAKHTLASVSVIGLGGGPEDCVFVSAVAAGDSLIELGTSGVAYNFSIDWDIATSAAVATGLYIGAGCQVYFCHADVNIAAGAGTANAIAISGGAQARQCIGYGHAHDGTARGFNTATDSNVMHCEGRAETDGDGNAYGFQCASAAEDEPVRGCYGLGETTGTGDGYGLRFGSATSPDVYVSHCYFDGDTADVWGYYSPGYFYSIRYESESLTNGSTITHMAGDRAGKARDETIAGAWTFDQDVSLSSGAGIDATDELRISVDGTDEVGVCPAGTWIADAMSIGFGTASESLALPDDGDLAVAGDIIVHGDAVKGTGSSAPTLGTTTETEKWGHAYLALTKDIYPDGETHNYAGLWRRFVNVGGLANYTHHRGTGTGVPAGCTLTATPANLWAAWLAGYFGWFNGTYYMHYPNHATLPAGLTVHAADPIAVDKRLWARIHTLGSDNFGVWADNFDADRAYIIGDYIYRFDLYTYGNGPETLIYTQVATSACTAPGVGVAATFAAWVNHANTGPYGPMCVCGDGISVQLLINRNPWTSRCFGYSVGETGQITEVGNYYLYDDAWPGSNEYAARRMGTFHRGQGAGRAAWDWYWLT